MNMGKTHTVLTTIGYEGANPADFIAALRAEAVSCLIDVRELAMSRRRGFAKTALSASLESAGINYIHLKNLGDPKAGREAARQNDMPRFLEIFSAHMRSDAAQADLRTAIALAVKGGVCLMCYERDASLCHRSVVATSISAKFPISIRHIGVRDGLTSCSSKALSRGPAEQRT
jgi:uncharacterized protein (DUF488 family)